MITPFIRRIRVLFAILLCAAVMAHPESAEAQDIITPMLEQIAKLELCLKEAQQGYAIVQKGLTTIGQIKQGDFDLHSLFFSSLMTVSPEVKGYAKVADILAMQIQIVLGCKTTLQQYSSTGAFNADELKYLTDVYANLSTLTVQDIDELTGLITDGNWQMTDDERLSRIDQLYEKVTQKYLFLRSFSNRVLAEAQIRNQNKNSLQTLSKLFQP